VRREEEARTGAVREERAQRCLNRAGGPNKVVGPRSARARGGAAPRLGRGRARRPLTRNMSSFCSDTQMGGCPKNQNFPRASKLGSEKIKGFSALMQVKSVWRGGELRAMAGRVAAPLRRWLLCAWAACAAAQSPAPGNKTAGRRAFGSGALAGRAREAHDAVVRGVVYAPGRRPSTGEARRRRGPSCIQPEGRQSGTNPGRPALAFF
jgi:hypothetical protein